MISRLSPPLILYTSPMTYLPSGTVTSLVTDIEVSTHLTEDEFTGLGIEGSTVTMDLSIVLVQEEPHV